MNQAFDSLALAVGLSLAVAGCQGQTPAAGADGGARDSAGAVDALDGQPLPSDATTNDAQADVRAPFDATPPADAMPPSGSFCSLPGSVLWTGAGPTPYVVPGAPARTPDMTWLRLPTGFCAHYFGNVADARQLRFAPGPAPGQTGDLFVASPTSSTTGGNTSGALGGIVILPDDNRDGVADRNITFLTGLPSVQGLLFANGAFYFQDDATIRSLPYQPGVRQPSGAAQAVTTIMAQQASEHWPKLLDIATDGTIYISNGGSQADACLSTWPERGAIFALGDGGATSLVTMGFRNPIALRCETKHNVCLAAELALDYSGDRGGREKVVPIRQGDNWGYPCCGTRDVPYRGTTYEDGGVPDCSNIAAENDSFVIGNTPFGLDFETGSWPAPWTDRVYVTLHGAAGSWTGARVVSIALDPTTGLPLPGSELDAGSGNTLLEFATGWDDNVHDHGRPAPVTFAPDGRMFLGNDNDGNIVWIAPFALARN